MPGVTGQDTTTLMTRAKAGGWGDKLPVLRTSEYVSGKNILVGIKT